ncbi:hypothetical protein ACSBR1_011232 [Camellia fascicularis]
MGIEDIPPSTQTLQTGKIKDKGLALPIVLEEQTRNNNQTPESVEHRLPFAGGSSHHFLLEKDYRDRIIDSMEMEIQELKGQLKRVMGDPTEKRTDAEPSHLRQRSPSREPPVKKVPRNESGHQSQSIPVQSEAVSSHTVAHAGERLRGRRQLASRQSNPLKTFVLG